MHSILTLVILLANLALQPQKLPQVGPLAQQGWQVQHACMSYDSLTIYFSAKAPNATSYDLYKIHAQARHYWSAPETLYGTNSDEDELWPSISSDEQTIYFIRRTPANSNEKNAQDKTQIYRGIHTTDDSWREVEPIIISGDADLAPRIMEDSKTLSFWRFSPKGKKKDVGKQPFSDGEWHSWYSIRMDDHNWMLADTCSRPPQSAPIAVATGILTDVHTNRPLPEGQVYVYDAITQQLLQIARVHPMTGRFRIALQANRHYSLDMTAKGYSHFYAAQDIGELSKENLPISFGTIQLSAQLQVRIQSYDKETYAALGDKTYDLPIGKEHRIRVSQPLYHDTVLLMNTQRQVRFAETELDVPLVARKRPYRFLVTNSKTGEEVKSGEWRLDNDHWRPLGESNDTTLRLNIEKALSVSASGYLFFDTIFQTGKDDDACQMRIPLTPLEKDIVLQLRNIQFEYNSFLLTSSSIPQLDQLVKLMQINPTLRIELSAHTDDQGSDQYNNQLSTKRGEAVAEYLTAQGIESSRVEAKGYGKRKPLVPNDSEENRALNRRVEFKVIDY